MKSKKFRFVSIFDIFFIVGIILSLTFCSKSPGIIKPELVYKGTLEEGITFSKEGNPNYIKRITGLAGRESWGRWSDQKMISIEFNKPLNRGIYLLQINAKAFGPNANEEVKIVAGSYMAKVKLGEKPAIINIPIESSSPIHSIELYPPTPTSPHQLDVGNLDNRKLGIGLISLKIL